MSDDYDDIDDFFERIKENFGLNWDKFDVDFLFLPGSSLDQTKSPKNKKGKGFKVTYHFEPGMDKPEIRIEGDFDQSKLQDYLKRLNLSKYSNFQQLPKTTKVKEINAIELQIEPTKNYDKIKIIEPYSELNEYEDFIEIILEVPGVEKGHFLLSLTEDGRNLKISAESQIRKFVKMIKLPFKCTMDDYSLDINNGIAILKLNKIKVSKI
ncbi:MAG: Hsp20/alpha crystallin family protein [Candidatus Odinarchaeota archaeon]